MIERERPVTGLYDLNLGAKPFHSTNPIDSEEVVLRLKSAVAVARTQTSFDDDQINQAASNIMNKSITSDVSLGKRLNDYREKISKGELLGQNEVNKLTKLHVLFKTISKADANRYTKCVFRASRTRLNSDCAVDQNVFKEDEKQSSVFSSFTKALLFENFKQRYPATENIELLKAWQIYWDDLKYKEALFYNEEDHQIIKGVRPTLYAKEASSLLTNEEIDKMRSCINNEGFKDQVKTIYFHTVDQLKEKYACLEWVADSKNMDKYKFFIRDDNWLRSESERLCKENENLQKQILDLRVESTQQQSQYIELQRRLLETQHRIKKTEEDARKHLRSLREFAGI